MTSSLTETVVLILICALGAQSAPISINETATPGYILLNTTCNVLTLSDSNLPWKYFRVDKTSTGNAIVLNQTLGPDKPSTNCLPKEAWNHMGIYTCDGVEHSDIVAVVPSLNNYPPTFCTKTTNSCSDITSASATVKEGEADIYKQIATISLCDMDVFKTTNKYPTIGITDTHLKPVNQVEGHFDIQLVQPFTYDAANPQQHAAITVSDGKHKAYSLDFIINVTDVDDRGPKFSQTVYHCNVSEGDYSGPISPLCVVHAEDEDKGLNATIGYKVLNKVTGGVTFSITGAGRIEIHGKLDRETLASYIVPVMGFQQDRPADRFDIATVVFAVTDIDDNPPVFTKSSATLSIMENTQNGAVIYQFTATDQDEGANAAFTYRLVDTLEAFTIDSDNGKLTVKNSTKLDRETVKGTISITVYADPQSKIIATNPTTATITLLDVNDNSPEFSSPLYETTILKTKRVGSSILNLSATDIDEGDNGRVVFSFVEGGSPFAISNTGQITLNNTISEEFKDVYHLVAKAVDQSRNLADRRSTSVPVMIHVTDVNIHPPVAAILEQRALSEDAKSGTPVAWLNVTDKDPADTISVTISSGNDGGAFTIEHKYLSVYTVKVIKALDRETTASYRLNLSCSDSVHLTPLEVNITILDENDNAPIFGSVNSFTTIENKQAHSYIGTLTATDADTGVNSNKGFHLDPDTKWVSNFTIGKTSGIITTLTLLDREALGSGESLEFTVYAVDHGQLPLTGSTTVTVTVQDLNDNPPVFEQANVTLTVKELQAPGLIHTAKASDKDIKDNKNITFSIFSITPMPHSKLFEVSPSDGTLITKRQITLNDSTTGTIQLVIEARNPGKNHLSAKQAVTLHIEDINNNVPKFGRTKYNTTISETTRPGESIIRITATDADILPMNHNVTYWLDGPHNDTFRIDPFSGEVFLVKNIDLDKTGAIGQYNLKVFASDNRPFYNGSKVLTVSVPLDVSVSNVNEYNPAFSREVYYCAVNETANETYTGTFGCTVHASDKDTGRDGNVMYHILNNDKLDIDASGELRVRVKSKLVYNSHSDNMLTVNVSATDGGSPSRTSYASITVKVNQVNKNPPRVIWRHAVRVAEGMPYPRGATIAKILVIDGDGNDGKDLVYDLDDHMPGTLFTVRNAIISLAIPFTFDYETKSRYVMDLSVKDDVHPAVNQSITIDVMPMNEFQPVITSKMFNVTERSSKTVQISAYDNDNGTDGDIITFRIADATMRDNVSITADGKLTITNLDREVLGEDGLFTVPVTAVDGGNLTTTKNIKIKVTGINDNPPYFLDREKKIELNVNEKTLYSNLFTSMAKDDDIGEGSAIMYRLKKGDINIFSVTQGGVVSIKSSAVRATNRSVTIEIEAYNPFKPELTASQSIKLTIQDINDNAPIFVKQKYGVSVNECLTVGVVVETVSATDADINLEYRTITYWMDHTTDAFSVDAKSGQVYLRRQLDYDSSLADQTYHLTVYATDSLIKTLTKSNHTANASVTVHVTSCNDNTPTFSQDMYFCSVNESYNGTFGCSVSAIDKDAGKDGDIAYQIVDNTKVTVDKTSGQLRINSSFNYDNLAEREIVVNVSATDWGSPPRSNFSTVRIQVKQVNKRVPNIIWDITKHLSVVEGATLPGGTQIGAIPVTDDDGNDGKPLIYTLDNDSKTLNDGVIMLKRDFTFDFETKSTYALEMSVKDDVHPVVKKNITVDVINVNEFQPVITSRTFSVTEESTTIVHISATDADKGRYGNVTFRLADNTIHNITLTADGQMTINNLDREVLGEDGVFTVPVTAVDGGNLTTTADIKIKVTGINDNTPYFLDREKHIDRTVNEKTPYSDVFTSVAYDDDIGTGKCLSYRLEQGDKSIFSVNTTSGLLSIKSRKLNAINRVVNLRISAYNPGTPVKKAGQTITLTIADINDQPPQFEKTKYNTTVKECQHVGSVIETVQATDADINLEYRTITYWRIASTTDRFSVNAKTGQIQLTGQLDYEDPSDRKIKFIVYATDLLNQTLTTSPNTTQTEVTVNVANCNDNAPKFTQGLYLCPLNENQTGAFGCTVKATDADKLAPVAYSISGNNSGFTISTTTGVITLAKKKDYDDPDSPKQFLLVVTASDGTLNSSATVMIDLKNDNDNAPTFSSQEYTFSVTENVDMGHVGEVTATDKDGDSIAYSSGTTSCTDLTISGNGTVLLGHPLDYESVRSCSLTVYANDSVHSPTAVVRLDVVDANDNYPQFTKTYDIRVNETKVTNKPIVQVVATDADGSGKNNKITYSILGGNTGDTFQIDATTGWITATKPLDASVRQAYSLLVEASDNGTPALSNVTAVAVFVEDINDNKPTFLYTPYNAQITENSTEQVLFEVIARDADPDAKLTLSILRNPYSNLFFFNGTFFCATTLDAEQIKKDVISVSIEVSDGHFKANTSVSIAITDINDNIPYFLNPSPSNINLNDTTPLGTKVVNITAVDKDFTNSEVMYILSYNFGFFEIDRRSGIITLQRTLDVQKYNKLNLTVTAIDSGSPQNSATANIIITVMETNKYTPTFINGSKSNNVFEINFVEDKAGQTHVISAYDNDTGPAGVISYSIKSPIGKVPDNFKFDNDTGKISLIRSIDFEAGGQLNYTIWIIARDHAAFSKSATATAVIHITDKDEAPKFATVTDIVYKELNASAGSTITTVTVTDPDVSEHFRNFTFTILPQHNDYFKIERLVGESGKAIVKANKTLSMSGTYNITVKVTDGGGLSDTAKLTIQVSNITGIELKTNISEGSSPPVVLTNLLDAAHLSSDTWFSLVKSNDSSNFEVLKNGSFVASRPFDREIKPEFKVEIKGNKNLSGEVIQTAQIQMHVTVLDVNDETPAFNSSTYNIAISENTPTATTITSVTASDKDINPTLRYLVNPPNPTFGINPSSGEIYLKQAVDHEGKTNNYSLTVECNDTLHTANATIIIKVTDENDVKPKFTNTSYTFRISESQPLGLIQDKFVNATDPDTDDIGKLTYSVLTGNSLISLEASGQLRLKTLLDYDTMGASKQVVVTAQVTDTAGHKNNATITIIVLDANDNAPNFTKPVYYYHVPEGSRVLDHSISVQASDKDSGNNAHLTFSLKGANQTLFRIESDGQKGYIHITHALDRESRAGDHDVNGSAVYDLTVIATDHGDKPQTASTLVHITVDDVNDCPPVFPSSNLTASVQEGTAIGTTILTVTTSDCDLLQKYKQVAYSFANGSPDTFNITSTGDVIVRKAVSVKEQAKYQLEIIASDGLLQSKAHLIVTILDANDHSPNFTRSVYWFSVSENVHDIRVGEVLATDDDPGENGNVTYAITSGNTGSVFKIEKVNSSGIVTVVAALDRETIPSYTLIVTAEDSATTGSRQGTCTVIVQVEDVNDNSPEFGQPGGYEGYVKEDATNDTQVKLNVPITATDSDNGNNGTAGIIYSILPVNQSQFCINDTTGAVAVCGALDRETTTEYDLKVVARDSLGDADCRNASSDLTIIVTDVNDNAPVFVSAPYTYSVPENATPGTTVGTVTVRDDDEHGLQAVRIRIANGSHENFYIETTQNKTLLIGTIFVSGVLDREDRSSYKLLVVANDAGRDASNAIVDIDIMDVNDNSPQFNDSRIEVSVVEGSKPGVVYTIAAYDLDAPYTNNSDVVFQFDQETITEFGNYFGIGKNGSIFTKQELDRENKNSSTCSLTVIASDKGRPPRQASATVTVHVLDVNDNSPTFCDRPHCTMNSYVVETQPVGSIIALPVATDPDKGENGTVVYSILTSPASKYFAIDSETGLVTIAQPILINTLIGEGIVNDTTGTNETVTVKITVVASDKGPAGGRQSNLTVIVRIEPINDNAPRFKDLCEFHTTEEQPSGSFVGDCEAIIPNATYSHLAYTLITGFDNSLFEINALNGTIRTTAVLDREVTSHYSLSVQVRDGRTPERTAFAAVTITVDDINDNSPEFLLGPFSLEVPENSVTWSQTINASAVDPDDGQNGMLAYIIDNNYDGKFHINNASGIVTVNGTFDYEQMTNYSFHVYASDNGSTPLTSSVLVTIAVLDVNDNAPMFDDVSAKYDVLENQTGTIFTLTATDKDSGYNGRVIYSITHADGGPFSIGPFDGRVFVDGHLDYETKSLYQLSFEAKDQGLKPLSTIINVTVAIKDVYDYIPMFPKEVYEVNLNASVAMGMKVIDLSIGKKGIEYHIAGSDSGLFSIEPASGIVTVRRPLGSHNRQDLVTVTATDGRGQTAQTTLIVHVNNHEVLFPENEVEVRLPENFNESTLLLDLNTTEELSGQHVIYSIAQIEPDVHDVFRIEPQTGEVYCDKALDREVHGEYVIHIAAVVASSHRARRQVKDWSSTMQLRVHIDDENDNRPVFNASQQTLYGVPADAKANYLLAVLHAYDPGLGANGRVFYTATGGNTTVFGVDRNTGSVTTLVAIASRSDMQKFSCLIPNLAYDPDLGVNGRVFYTATGGNTTVFGVDRNTGTVTTLVAIASIPGAQRFSLSVTANDGSGEPGPNSTLELQILVVPRIDRLMLQINTSTSQFRQKQALFIGNMSKLLGVDVQLESIESHREKTASGTRLDLARTDMFFHGVNKTTGMIVPFDVMMGLIDRKQDQLRALFGNQALEVTQVKMAPHDDPSAITVPIIALFCVAIFIFLGAFIAVVLTLYSWTRMNKQRELLEKRRQARDVKMSDFEMNSLRSRASKRGGAGEPTAAGAVNPVFLETEFVARKEKPAEKKITYETQELCLQFAEEPLRFSAELMTTNGNGARSVADSALENTSLTSNDQLRSEASCRPNGTETNGDVLTGPQMGNTGLNGVTGNGDSLNANTFGLKAGEGPMMTSSPRISKDYDAEGKIAILGQGVTSRLAAPNLRLSMERLDDMDKSRETDTDADLVDDKDGSKVADEDVKTTARASFESSSKKTAPDPATLSSKEDTSSRPGSYAAEADREPAKVIEEQIYSEVDDVEVTSF